MLHVRAMFRVLNTSRDYALKPLIRLAPTYQSRDGIVCEENKSFSKWTPAGECEMVHEPVPTFSPGSYVYLDFYEKETEPPCSEGTIRTNWMALRFEVDAGGCAFTTRLYPAVDSPIRGTLWMSVTNMSKVVVEMFKLEPGGPPKMITVDFSPVP